MDTEDTSSNEGEVMEVEPDCFASDEILDSSLFGLSKVIECELCHQMFTNKTKITAHWVINHSYKLCQLCSHFAFKYDSDKIQHERQHLPFSCSSCTHEFNTVEDSVISEHYKQSHKSFLCKFCASVVNPASSYPEHLQKKHNVTEMENYSEADKDVLEFGGNLKSGFFGCKLCGKKKKSRMIFGHFAFYHNFSIHAVQNLLRAYPHVKLDGTTLNDQQNQSSADEDDEIDGEFCKVCENPIAQEKDSQVHGVFCKGFVICKLKECEKLFKNEKALTSHLDNDHPKFPCKFGCSEMELKTNEIDDHLQKLHDIVECYFCDIINSSGNFKNHLRDKHSVDLKTYENALSNAKSKLFRVDEGGTSRTKKMKVLCNFCNEDITKKIKEFSFISHYSEKHEIKMKAIIQNLAKNPIIDTILSEKQSQQKELECFSNFNVIIDESSVDGLVETDFDTSKVSCIGYEDHQAKTSKSKNSCEFCKRNNFDASCQLYQHLNESHGFKLLNVKDYCQTCELHIIPNEIEIEGVEDTKDFNLSLVCPLDQSYHVTKDNFKKHIEDDHFNDEQKVKTMDKIFYKCLECNYTYKEINEIRQHFKTQHPTIQMNYCRICRYKFKDSDECNEHFNSNHSEKFKKNFLCKICKKVFKRKYVARQHFESAHSNTQLLDKKLKCRLCSEYFENFDDRKLHLLLVHPDEKSFSCKTCPLKFSTKGGLSSHAQIHKETSYSCEFCGKVFGRRDSWKEHLLIHSTLRHKCSFCEKDFVQRSNLVRHERIHSGSKPYKCDYCEKTFSDKGACTSHETVHTKAQTCYCDVCGKQFSRKQKLKYHMRIHSKEHSFNCNVCDKRFGNAYSLNRHLEVHESNRKVFECNNCWKEFKSRKCAKNHEKKCHPQDPTMATMETKIICMLCNEETGGAAEIQQHLRDYHQVEDAAEWQSYVRDVEFEMNATT